MKIQDILDALTAESLLVGYVNIDTNQVISGLPRTSSSLVQQDDIFICISGFQADGHQFAAKAVMHGASLVIHEKSIEANLPGIGVKNSRKAAAILAKLYYHNPSSKFKLIGVTGTNGKTTITTLISQLLTAQEKKVGLIGTLGYSILGVHYPSNRTTPDIMDLNRIFSDMVSAGCEYVVMEVSSHALALERVYGLEFDFSIFTNLSRDHLDFHQDMESYAQAKFLLFEYLLKNNGHALINIDDSYGLTFYKKIHTNCSSISFVEGDFKISNIHQNLDISEFTLIHENQNTTIKSTLLGKFNIMNVAMAIATTHMILPQTSWEELSAIAEVLKPPVGRLEAVINHQHVGVFVDYAHTPDALENVLNTLQELKPHRLLCLIGSGGDRDKGKRPEMGKVAVSHADITIFTDDNPRSESPVQIIRDMVADLDPFDSFWIIRNRKIAIESILHLAQPGDIVLLAGKGHETYQEINGEKQHFDDREIADAYLKAELISDDSILALPIDPLMLEFVYGTKINLLEKDTVLTSISTDSRKIGNNALFFAIKGDNFDGHTYVEDVLRDTSCYAVVSTHPAKHEQAILVEDTVKALGLLAEKYLSLFRVKKIALTGSVGKTTTKEFIFNIMNIHGSTLKTLANENNYIGLPKTIFRVQPNHKFAVLELGTNHSGEIQMLADICHPDIGIITNIGPSHLEFFDNEDGVFQEKIFLFKRHLEALIYPGDDVRFASYMGKGISFGLEPHNTYHLKEVSGMGNETHIKINNESYQYASPVPFYAMNVLIAVAVGKLLGFSETSIQKGLNNNIDLGWRMKVQESGKRKLILDCYNANPMSMLAALEYWVLVEPKRPHIAILGDMLELGDRTDSYHQQVSNYLKMKHLDVIITVGEKAKLYGGDSHFQNVDLLIESGILQSLDPEAIILLKASHGIHLEKLIGRL